MKSSEIGLGSFTMNVEDGRILGEDGRECELRHQAREVLRVLAKNPGEIVSKAEFFETIWDGAHVSEDSLVQCVADIRQVIGDTDKAIIQTVPRKGYRLVPTPVPERTAPPLTRVWGLAALALVVGLAGVWMTRPQDPGPRVIAVLPFKDDSPAQDRGTLGNSISAGVRANLARYPELTIIARNSSQQFRDGSTDVREIGRILGANYIVEGSQQLDGEKLRVTAQLVEVATNAHVWSDQIDTELHDLLEVTALVSKRVANSVEAYVYGVQAGSGGENEVDALLLNLKQRKLLLSGPSRDNVEAAIAINRKSIELYPDEAWGHIGLAFSLRTMLRFGWSDTPDAMLQEAMDHAQRAVKLAPENYLAHFALGRVRMQQANQIGAIESFETALSLNPSSADVMNALGQSYFYLGENDRALEFYAQSERIDPLPSFVHPWMTAWTLWQAERCETALEYFNRMSTPAPEAHKLLAAIHVCNGEIEKAEGALAAFLKKEPSWSGARERSLHAMQWVAPGALDRWVSDLEVAGLPNE